MRLSQPTVIDVDLIDAVVAERQAGAHAAYFKNIQNDWKANLPPI